MAESGAHYDIDLFMDKTGHCGRYEVFTYSLLSISMIYCSFATFSYCFTCGEIPRRCFIPECEIKDKAKFDAPLAKNATKMDISNPCKRYDVTASFNETAVQDTCPAEWFSKSEFQCKEEDLIYEFDDITIMHDFNLQCKGSNLLSVVGSLANLGQAFGFPTLGYLSDRFGRKPLLIITTCLTILCGFVHMFNQYYIDFVIVEMLMGYFVTGLYNSAYVLGVELVGRKCRVVGGVTISTFYAFGLAFLALVAMGIRNWKHYSYVHLPFLVCILYIWIIPESTRWLNLRGKEVKLKKELLLIGKFKGHKYTEDELEQFKSAPQEPQQAPAEVPEGENEQTVDEPPGSEAAAETTTTEPSQKSEPSEKPEQPAQKKGVRLKVLFKSRTLILRLINCYYCWITNSLVYVGLQLAAVSTAGDRHVNFMISALVEIPGYIVTPFMADYLGRRNTLSGSLLVCGLCNLTYPFLATNVGGTVIYFTGKLAITISYAIIYVYTAELFPTELRHTILGSCSMVARIGAITAPLWSLFNKLAYGLAFYIFAFTCTTSGLLLCLMPETVNLKLPDTVEEAEQIKSRKRKRND